MLTFWGLIIYYDTFTIKIFFLFIQIYEVLNKIDQGKFYLYSGNLL